MTEHEAGFELDSRILHSSSAITSLHLCEARLQADERWPWIVLVPRRPGLRELEDLQPDELADLTREMICAGRAVRALGEALGRPVHKLNVAALGNIVAQLHVHVVGRRTDDPAWPGPVWGVGIPVPYRETSLDLALETLRRELAGSSLSRPDGVIRSDQKGSQLS